MTKEQRDFFFAWHVLQDCPDALTDRHVLVLVKAGIELPAEVRGRFGKIFSSAPAEAAAHVPKEAQR